MRILRWNLRASAILCFALLQAQSRELKLGQGTPNAGKPRKLLQELNGGPSLLPASFLDTPSLQGSCPKQAQQLAGGRALDNPMTTRYGVLKKTILKYPKGNQLCGSSLTIKGTVLIKKDGACRPCPGAKCKIWSPNGEGEYDTKCSATVIANDKGQYQFKSDVPGNERSKLWGPDPFGHWHFECSGCGGMFFNKFYSKQHDFSGLTEKGIGRPDSSNHAKKVPGTKNVLAYDMLMEARG